MRLWKASAMVVILGLSVAGCGGSGAPATTTTAAPTTARSTTTAVPTSRAGTSTSASPTTAPPTTTAPSTTTGPAPLCTTAELGASFGIIPGSAGAGNVVARIVLTNTGSAICRTYGYVGMQLLGSGGGQLPTDVVRVPGTNTYPVIDLAPGASASATARFSPDVAGPGEPVTGQCEPTATSTEITPPDNTTHLVVKGPGTPVCEHGTMSVSPLQAGSGAGG